MKTLHLAIIIVGIVLVIIFAFILMNFIKTQENKWTTDFCNLACKNNYEKEGDVCTQNLDVSYTCRPSSSHVIEIVIPRGSTKIPTQSNFIANNITVSLEINNTVSWTNVDDSPHRVVSNNGFFDSGVIQPNATWVHVFDRLGKYTYHDPSYSWLNGYVNVVPLDPNYKVNEPIWKNLFGADRNFFLSDSALFRETDHWGYVKKVSSLENNTVSVTLADYKNGTYGNTSINRIVNIGDRIVADCTFVDGHSQISDFVLTRISNVGIKFAEFDEHVRLVSDNQCNFTALMKENQ